MFKRIHIIIGVFFLTCAVMYAEQAITIIAVGDMRLDGYIGSKIEEHGYAYPFEHVQDIFDASDITYGNLECSVSTVGEPVDKKYVFQAKPAMIQTLKIAGFDIVDLANNHSGDYGKEAFVETMRSLKSYDIEYVGAGLNIQESRKPVIIKKRGQRIAFLSYSNTFPKSFWATKDQPGVTPAYVDYIIHDVKQAKKQSDAVIVAYHGGDERSDAPKQSQKDIAYAAINAGAAMVLGHHVHLLQGIEVYKGKPIVYSLGNFLFLSKDKRCYDSMIVWASFERKAVNSLKIIPIRISDAFVRKANAVEAERILGRLKTLSHELGADLTIANNSGYLTLGDVPDRLDRRE